ncbi:BRO family protein [Streptomyces sp. NBC_01803]|uniref:BRO family protein n=1 Tax=Streptomyces sp. NBC_01803 TaxID=2975946 RepID=UPI002DDA9120|nr:phage antirepressor KilAC domain-containing protein [Streptomyces sp. NBC_01803]WSA45010.1 phage antirepressor KilAC domain-containing protein [Streptomyces sp. NBC_01803]
MTIVTQPPPIEQSGPGIDALQLFDISGEQIRFGITDDGTAYAVAADFAKTLDYSTTQKALQIVDADEKGREYVSTWVPQEVNHAGQSVGEWQKRKQWVIFEDGLWELIFRSTLPGAKAIKKQVKAILREIRETGRYQAAAVPQTFAEALELAAAQQRELEAAQAQVAALEPKAAKYDRLLDADGLVGMTAIADMLDVYVGDLTDWLVEQGLFRKQVSEGQSGPKTRNMPRREWQRSGHFEVIPERRGRAKFPVAYATSTGLDLVITKWSAR